MQLLIQNSKGGLALQTYRRLPFGDRAVGFAEIPADAGLSP
jgi:hypothetical protein